MDAYSKRVGIKKCVDRLFTEGISRDIDVPQIVVLGSQSAGKSSLFEGISKIPLPKSHSTCTRCPIICHMQNTDTPWSCRVEIMREGNRKEESPPKPQYSQFGGVMKSLDQVRDRISRAQAAILQPTEDLQEFVDATYIALGGDEGFSSDSIVVKIEGPDVVDLSFVDLPGIIAAGKHVEDVRKMAEKYIGNKNNIILLVLNCADDKENQGAQDLVDKYDKDRKRTITVLTKPDKHDVEDEAKSWRDDLRKSSSHFCVKQPGPKDPRNMSWEEAREREMNWFYQGWWSEVANDPVTRQQIGTENLINYLNSRLLNLMVERLPTIRDDLRKQLRALRGDLGDLPAEIEDPIRQTNQLIWSFDDTIKGTISHNNFKIPELVGKCRRALESYTDTLVYHLCPRFCPIRRDFHSGSPYEDAKDFLTTLPAPPKTTSTSPKPNIIYLDEIIQKCDVGRSLEMPGNSPYGVQKGYMEVAVEAWHQEVEDVLDEIFGYISTDIGEALSGKFPNLGGLNIMLSTVRAHLENRRNQVHKALIAALRREKRCSLIYGCPEYTHLKKLYAQHYLSLRLGGKAGAKQNVRRKKTLRTGDAIHIMAGVVPHPGIQVTGHVIGEVVDAVCDAAEPHMEDLPEDDISPEEKHAINIMAETRTFYHMAVRRYAEGTAQIIFHDLLLDIQGGAELQEKLRVAIGISTESGSPCEADEVLRRCKEFVEPSFEVVERRKTLYQRRAMLQSALNELSDFGV